MATMYKVSRPKTHGDMFCVWKNCRDIEAEFDGAEIGEVIQVEVVEMTDAEFDALGEFIGW